MPAKPKIRETAAAVKLCNIRIASPCTADWDKMRGDDSVRHCTACNLNVYNFSAMTETEVEHLLGTRQGRLCARFYRRADGTILTQDCPVGWRTVVRRVSRVAGAALSAVMSVGFAAAQSSPREASPMGEVQQQTAGIAVLVLDPQGAVITNARIVLNDEAGNTVARGVTDQGGQITLAGLQGGPYFVEVSAPGFRTRKESVDLKGQTTIRIEIKLDVAANLGVIVENAPSPVVIDETYAMVKTDLDFIPYTAVPTAQPSFFKRFFAGLFHKLGF
ncbi:MAG TPA: carboxypeptidase-like regulatory domain-containing protein [Candidatus Angelobacter sp.]